jgi:uncharacterized protein (TIGR03437 family)
LVSDDMSGAIYRMVWAPSAISSANGYGIIAPGSYAAVYGSGLADQTATAASPQTTLAGVSLDLIDIDGQPFHAQLIYVSPSQINFLVPGDIPAGAAQVFLNPGSNARALGWTQIHQVAPGLFSLNGDGNGPAAATAQNANGSPVQVFNCGSSGCLETAINVGNGTVFLSLYGTGIRGAASGSVQVRANGIPVPVRYAGPQGTYPGLDQINVDLPSSLAGSGETEMEVFIGSTTSNIVTIRIQ